jgi:MoaA/NifB/PqqE/SkfB family radical SAM enzyme
MSVARAARFALTVLENRVRRVPRPATVTYLVSYRCNARCGMCDSWRMKPGRELTVDEVDAVFAKLGRLDAVRLSGGEPCLRPDLPEIAAAVCRRSDPLLLHVTTNGSRPRELEALVRAVPRPDRLHVMVSFDGLAERHDASRGAEVTFACAFATVERMVAHRHRGVTVSVNHTVISARSLADAPGLRARFAALGVPVQTVLAYAESSMYGIKLRGKRATHMIVPTGYPLHPDLAGADAAGLVRDELARVGELPLALRVGKRYYLRGLLERLERTPAPSLRPPCAALRAHLRLLPDGRVPVCQFNTESVGNLLDDDLEAVWHAPDTGRQRAWVDACPGCWAECEVMPSAVYSGDLLRALV